MLLNLFKSYGIWNRISTVFINAPQNKSGLLLRQEIVLIREVRNKQPGYYAQEEGDSPFNDLATVKTMNKR